MSSELSNEYIGLELDIFAHAVRWKNYWGKKIRPYLGEEVLEVGAGIGTNTGFLLDQNPDVKNWVCLEPDRSLADQIPENYGHEFKDKVEIQVGTLEGINERRQFDSVLYIDVIEHIEDHEHELKRTMRSLKQGGHLIILVPAHNYLFSEFDKSIGHFRRYNKPMLRAVIPGGLNEEKVIYLDSMGMCSSLANKWFLKQTYPTVKQIKFWDSIIVGMSRFTDVLLFYQVGKSLLGVWKKT